MYRDGVEVWILVPQGSSEVSAMWGSPLSLEASHF